MEAQNGRIHVTHLNIRPSIFIILFQLLFLNVLSYVLILAVYLLVFNEQLPIDTGSKSLIGLALIVLIFVVQFSLTVYGVLQWMNDYYEITPQTLIHKKGLIFRKLEKYSMEHVQYIDVRQGILGKIFNYGTLSLYDRRRTKFFDLYLIHNPTKYLEVLENLNPQLDETEEMIGNI